MISDNKNSQYEIHGHPKNWAVTAFYGCSLYLGELLFSDKFSPGFTYSSDSGLTNGKEDIYSLYSNQLLGFYSILL